MLYTHIPHQLSFDLDRIEGLHAEFIPACSRVAADKHELHVIMQSGYVHKLPAKDRDDAMRMHDVITRRLGSRKATK